MLLLLASLIIIVLVFTLSKKLLWQKALISIALIALSIGIWILLAHYLPIH